MNQKNNSLSTAVAFMVFMMFVVCIVGFIILKEMGLLYFWVYMLAGTVSSLVFSLMMYWDIKDEIKLNLQIDEAP